MNGARVLLLAAGRGRRAGGPKAWLPYGGKTLLEAHLGFLGGLFGREALSISIQDGWRERCAALAPDARWVACDPDAAPLASLQALITGSPARRSFVLHVDMPVFEPAVYEALWASPAAAAVPVFGGRRGHPVLLAPTVLAQVARLDPARDRLDEFLRGERAAEIPVPSDAILRNFNEGTP